MFYVSKIFSFSAKILPLVCTLALVGAQEARFNDDPSQARSICAAAPASNNILVTHMDCSKFYMCSGGKPIAMDCPKGLLYNPRMEWCDWPRNVNCKTVYNKQAEDDEDLDSFIRVEYNSADMAEKTCDAEASQGILLPHAVCSKYFKCHSGKPYVYDCPPRQVYDADKKYCDYPQNVNCGVRT